jgi:hypothetical protein
MNGRLLYSLAVVLLLGCVAFGSRAWGGIEPPTSAAWSSAVGGACANLNCGQTDTCNNQPPGSDYASMYYDYKQKGIYSSDVQGSVFGPTPDCVRVDGYHNSNCNTWAGPIPWESYYVCW